MINAVIVEDSRLARVELKSLLANFVDINVIGEAENGEQGIDLIHNLKPDVVFLDINMPEMDGFDMLSELTAVPEVIFTTAYDQYAIKSFEYNAMDYLLKPIEQSRLEKAIEKLRSVINQSNMPSNSAEESELTADSKFFVKDNDDCWLVKLAEVMMMESIGNYTRVYFDVNQPMIYKPLSQIEKKLKAGLFFRANRQQLVNLSFIQSVETSLNGVLLLSLTNQRVIEVSRRQAVEFKKLFSL